MNKKFMPEAVEFFLLTTEEELFTVETVLLEQRNQKSFHGQSKFQLKENEDSIFCENAKESG